MSTLVERLKGTFPLTPYPSQLDLAQEIYQSLANDRKVEIKINNQVSIFESPTGTGKSFCLIVGVIRWLLDTQDGQVIKDVKKNIKLISQDTSLPSWFTEYEPENTPQPQIQQQQIKKKVNISYPAPDKIKSQQEDDFIVDIPSDDDISPTIKKIKQTKAIQIIYCSRTHTQIKQFVQEIKKIPNLTKSIRLVTLSSRQQLCINQSINKSSQGTLSRLNHLCKMSQKESKQSKSGCTFYNNFKLWKQEDDGKSTKFQQNNILDIEDLKKEGISCSICPYYAAKHQLDEYDIICMPYQLLLDKISTFTNPIVIIDEAHNFGNAVLQKSSSSLSHKQLTNVISGLITYKQKYHQRVKAKTFFLLTQLLTIAQGLLLYIDQEYKKNNQYTQIQMIQLMVQLGLQNLELAKLMRFLDNTEIRRRINGFIDSTQDLQNISYASFEAFCSFIQVLVLGNQSECVIYIERDPNLSQTLIKLSALANDTTYQNLLDKCQNLILIGGTMKPLNELEVFEKKLETTQFIQKTYPHIIPQDSCKLVIVPGFLQPLSFSYKSKTENINSLLQQTGLILQEIQQIVPKGVVVFTQSYSILNQLEVYINSNKNIKWNKRLFWDKNSKDQNIFLEYQNSIKNNNVGAMLFSVVGGTLSEGINFSDDLCRAVVILGVPFPNVKSIEVQEQMKKSQNGQDYYENMAMKGVNQSIGRAIRHIKDYALLYLVDQKFTDKRIKNKLSEWLQTRICTAESKEQLIEITNEFFINKQITK